MPSADKTYHAPSRGSRALIIVLSLGVVLLAGWIVTANLASLYGSPPAVDPQSDQVAEAQAPADDAVAVTEPTDVAAAEAIQAEEEAPTAAATAPWPEPIIVASAQDPPLSMSAPAVAPVIDPETTQALDEPTFGPGDLVPLPPKRPRVAAIPVPRPRPDIGIEPEPAGRVLSDAEIARMQ